MNFVSSLSGSGSPADDMLLFNQAQKRQTRRRRRTFCSSIGQSQHQATNYSSIDQIEFSLDSNSDADNADDDDDTRYDKEPGRHHQRQVGSMAGRRSIGGSSAAENNVRRIRLAMAGCFAIGSRRFVLLRWTPISICHRRRRRHRRYWTKSNESVQCK